MAKTYEPIATTTLGSDVASYTFSSIPQTYTDLILISTVKGSGNEYEYIQVGNGSADTGTNYSFTLLGGSGSAASSARASNVAQIQQGYAYTTTTDYSYQSTSHFMNYSNTTTNKTIITRADNANYNAGTSVGLWRSAAAINTIKIFLSGSANLKAGSTFTLYGIKAA